jgi:beta-glucanase (GH16 family)
MVCSAQLGGLWLTLGLVYVQAGPWGGWPQQVPGWIDATKFDDDGAWKAYGKAKTHGNMGAQRIRAWEEMEWGMSGGIGYLNDGDWVKYTVDVQYEGWFGVKYVMAGKPGTETCTVPFKAHLLLDSWDNQCWGGNILGAWVDVKDFTTYQWTDGWDFGGGDVWLPKGRHTITLCFQSVSWLNFYGIYIGPPGNSWYVPEGEKCNQNNNNNNNNGGNPGWGWKFKWGDDFDWYDESKWKSGGGHNQGWGNNEAQSYQPSNVWIEDGKLVLFAEKRWQPDAAYTSGKIASRTENGYNMQYGKIDVRAKFEPGQGHWPAIWMMPGSYLGQAGPYGRWPNSGELDIVEILNNMDQTHHSLHYGAQGNRDFQVCHFDWGGDFGWQWHTYTLEWAPWGVIKWFVDGTWVCEANSWWSIGGPFPKPFDSPFHVLLNYALGGSWVGPINDWLLPSKMYVDYVHVYEHDWKRRLPEGWEHPPEDEWDIDAMEWKVDPGQRRNLRAASPGLDIESGASPFSSKATCSTMPYKMTPNNIPDPWTMPDDRIMELEAELYDRGGNGCGYYEKDRVENGNGSFFRDTEALYLESYPRASHGPYAANVQEGEWLSYTVHFPVDVEVFALELVSFSEKGAVARVVVDSYDCVEPSNDGGFMLIPGIDVAPFEALEWRRHGATASISGEVHQLLICVVEGSLNLDYIRFVPDKLLETDAKTGDYLPSYSIAIDANTCISSSCADPALYEAASGGGT